MTTKFRVLDREEFIMRAAYDLDGAQERSNKKVMEKPAKPTAAERATLYNRLRAEGANPDEAAQAAGWKNFNSAQASCCKNGIKISTKAATVEAAQPRKAAVINEKFEEAFSKPDKPVTVNETVTVAKSDDHAPVPDKPRKHALRSCSWEGKDFLYTDAGDYIEITPHKGNLIQLTHESLRQFSEEINELLEIIK